MILFAYIKTNKKVILFTFLVFSIFILTFYLYGLPMIPVLYASLLGLVVGIILGAYDFWKFVKKHRLLKLLTSSIGNGMEYLPVPDHLIEEDYYTLLQVLLEEKAAVVSQMDQNMTNMLDYYSLWVHQIKTPIAAMSLLLQQEEIRQDQLREELFKIERYAEMVLQYLRMESISSDLNLQAYNLESMVRQAVKKYAPLFIWRKIGVEMRDLSIKVITDEKWLVFVIEQLLSNGLKYSNQGTIHIYVISHCTLVIEDEGIGIRSEDLPRVFEKGFTGYNGRMDKKSTGIGLYLCAKLCQKLSHPISISSELNRGTKIMIDLSREDTCIE